MRTTIWDSDRLSKIINLLNEAARQWDKQGFEKPTKERTFEVIFSLREARDELEDVISDLEDKYAKIKD